MPQYSWRCFVCEAVNEAGAATCSSCGFPASATGAQIEHARAVRSGTASSHEQPRPDFTADIQAALAPLPAYRRFPAVIGGLLVIGGVAWFKVTFTWTGVAFSLLAVGGGFVLVALAYVGIDNQGYSRNAS